MKRIIVNLDWGSLYLKGCARAQARPGTGIPIQMLGHLQGNHLLAQQTIQLPENLSLKAEFLSERLSETELEGHRKHAEELFGRTFIQPLVDRLRSWTTEDLEFRFNVHTPLQLADQAMVLGSGVFDLFDQEERLVVPAYHTLPEWEERMGHRAQPLENKWAYWLAGCLVHGCQKVGVCPEQMLFCFLPESLTCVQDLVGSLEINESRQFLVMDVGHFTTDYAIVAFHNDRNERMIVRRANSIFDAGHHYLQQHGQQSWIERVMRALKSQSPADHPTIGIHGYTDLGLVLVGGGSLGLNPSSRDLLLEEVQDWALKNKSFREAYEEARRKVYLTSPPHLTGPFELLGASSAIKDMDRITANLHVPCILACGLADTRTGMRMVGEKSLEGLKQNWDHRGFQPVPPVTIPLSVESPRTVNKVQPQSPISGATPAKNGSHQTYPALPKKLNPLERAKHLYDQAWAKNSKGRPILPPPEREGLIQEAARIGYPPAVLYLALLHVRTGVETEERKGHKMLVRLSSQGDREAQFHLGKLHVKQEFRHLLADPSEGIILLNKAAKAEHSSAMMLLAECYEDGIGTKQSSYVAEVWRTRSMKIRQSSRAMR